MAEQQAEIIPRVEEISFSGKLAGTLEQVKQRVSTLPFFLVRMGKDSLSIARVESRNIKKKPFLFYIITISGSDISVVYSIAPDTSETLRRLFVLKNLTSLLSLIYDYYRIDEVKFLQYIDSAMDGVLNGLSQSYSLLFNKYDALLVEYRELRRLSLELASSNRNLTLQTSQLDDENKKLKEQLKTLQTYSDESLMAMIEDWIETNNNSIDIGRFSETYKIPAPRVEQILDKMVSLGYIELKS